MIFRARIRIWELITDDYSGAIATQSAKFSVGTLAASFFSFGSRDPTHNDSQGVTDYTLDTTVHQQHVCGADPAKERRSRETGEP
jgi:hypothetical protein